jgi:hypothetical protein
MIGEVSWEPKRRRAWASWYSILSGLHEVIQATGKASSPIKREHLGFETLHFVTFFFLVGHFCHSGSTEPTESGAKIVGTSPRVMN